MNILFLIYFYCITMIDQLMAKSLYRRSIEVEHISTHKNKDFVQDIMRLSKSAEMTNYMNVTADPCNDFYNFACGNWRRYNPATAVYVRTSILDALDKAFDRKVKELLNNPIDDEKTTESDRRAHTFYESCMNLNELNGKYKDRLKELINEVGSMPVLQTEGIWNADNKFDWIETVGILNYKYDAGVILGFGIITDFEYANVTRVFMSHDDFTLETRSMYLDKSNELYRVQYKNKIASNLQRYLDVHKNASMKAAQEILDFEISMARGLEDSRDGLTVTDLSKLRTIDELQETYAPILDIKKLINISLGEIPTEKIYEFADTFQKNLVKVIAGRPKYVIANYIYYHFIHGFIVKIETNPQLRSSICLDKIKKFFARSLDQMIYRRYNLKSAEKDIELIWKELKKSLKVKLQSDSLDWIQPSTKQYALEKLDAMDLEINAYQNDNSSDLILDIDFSNDDFLENLEKIYMKSSEKVRIDMHNEPQPFNVAEETLSFTPVNILIENLVKVPVSLLQPYYLWADNYPNALKFGNLGALIGHELIHGFDDSGRLFDKDGNANDWWDKNSAKMFLNRTKCFTEQYSNYRYNGKLLAKSILQSENIADNGGMRLAYDAYLRWYENQARTFHDFHLETLPHMNYTSQQMFFISFAQLWCNDIHPDIKDFLSSTDDHVPGKYRVIGALSNFPAFSKAYQCERGSAMNPAKKCEIY